MPLVKSPVADRTRSASTSSGSGNSSDFAILITEVNSLKRICVKTNSQVIELQELMRSLVNENKFLKSILADIQDRTSNILVEIKRMNSTTDEIKLAT